MKQTIFLSLGNPYLPAYRAFAEALVTKFGDQGMDLKSVGYNVGTHQRPMVKILELLGESKGAVIVAFKRVIIEQGSEKGQPLPPQTEITTPWNHIEAALAYDRGLPLLVLVEKGLKQEGLLERGHDWYVHEMEMTPAALDDAHFKLLFTEWREALGKKRHPLITVEPENMKLGELLRMMKVGLLVKLGAGLLALLAAAFKLGMTVAGK